MQRFKILNLDWQKISALVFVPLVIGGFWQVLALLAISPFYLRFFSTTQMIADGLIIVVLLGWVYIVFELIYSNSINVYKNISKSISERSVFSALFGIIGSCFLLLLINHLFSSSEKSTIIIFWILLPFLILIVMDIVISSFVLIRKINIIDRCVKYLSSIDFVRFYVQVYVLMAIALVIGYLLFLFHSDFSLSPTFVNLNNVCEYSSGVDSCKIIYFNDKYIFLEIIKEEKSFIEIKSFDVFYHAK